MSSAPLVSVIIATYNRSNLLAHAIESVRSSTLEDWELIVVGDHCTDDTDEVVASFADVRITYVNLPRNVGEQSGPHNEGLSRVRGRYVAFLNQDDMYFPEHLAGAISGCEQQGADFVWVPLLVAVPTSEDDLQAGRWGFRLSGVPVDDGYDPRLFVFASAWVLTRELAERIGRWRAARETFVSSSQDWLFRAWRSGATMRFLPHATVLALPSAEFRHTALELASVAGEQEANRYRFGRSWLHGLRALAYAPVSAAAMRLGAHPNAPYFALRYGRRGNLINAIRRSTGLKDIT